jgi:hypothetical protein
VGGMIVSTVLNLIVIPAMYIIFDDGATRLRSLTKRSASIPAAAAVATE